MLCFHKVSFCRQEGLHWEDKLKICSIDTVCVCVCVCVFVCVCVCLCVCVCVREKERESNDSTGSRKSQMAGCYEGGIEPTYSLKCSEFLDYLNNSLSWS